jgi:hypothetical protein
MTMPNFLIIGAMKSGTTALYHYLRQHPQIYMSPKKEPRFFALEGKKPDFRGPKDQERVNLGSITNVETYRALFQEVLGETAVGEATPLYLYSPEAPKRIQHYIPDAKLIAILRNPIDRAYSSFMHCTRLGREPLRDFTRALQEEDRRIRENWSPIWHYKRAGFYYVQLKRYLDTFDKDRIKVYLYEDLQNDPIYTARDAFRFLDVDDTYVPDTSFKYNVTGIVKNRLLHEYVHEPNWIKSALRPLLPAKLRKRIRYNLKNRNLVKPPLTPEMRRQLVGVYREDILKLQELIDRDLSGWLEERVERDA